MEEDDDAGGAQRATDVISVDTLSAFAPHVPRDEPGVAATNRSQSRTNRIEVACLAVFIE